MGNREDLLAGARKCILERGVANTTARDIASSAGVSLAAIGYHFGSKDQLITEALTEALGVGIGDDLEALMRTVGAGRPLSESFAPTMAGMTELFERNHEGLLASLENLLRVHRSESAQQFMTQALETAYRDMAAVLGELDPRLDDAQARGVAQLYFVLLQGLAMLWLLNPNAELPSGAALAAAVTAVSA